MNRTRFFLTCAAVSAAASAQLATATELNFISCPIVRDTYTVPCWLSEHDGELYYLGIQNDISSEFHPPYLGHKVIVEGVVTDKERICGGIVLDPVVISPDIEADANCNTILPPDERYQVTFNPRPPGPNMNYRQPRAAAAAPAQAPVREEQEFTINYYFNGKVEARNSGTLGRIVRYAQQIDAARIDITSYQSDLQLTSGEILAERDGLDRDRANEVAKILQDAGLSVNTTVSWNEAAEAGWQGRRSVIRVIP